MVSVETLLENSCFYEVLWEYIKESKKRLQVSGGLKSSWVDVVVEPFRYIACIVSRG